MDKVSIIIPIYNSEKYLKRCLDSVLEQNYSNIEIILINDGSTDKSIDIIKSYLSHPKIILLNQENQGQSIARNNGIKIASGKYITFLDSDDWINKNYIGNLYKAISNGNSDISVSNAVLAYDNGKAKRMNKFQFYKLSSEEALNELLLDGVVKSYAWGKMYKTELFIKNQIEFPSGMYYEDLATLLKLFYSANNISFVNEYDYFYYQNNNSSSRKPNRKNFNDRLQALCIINRFLIEKNIKDKFKKNFNHLCIFHLSLIIKQSYLWKIDIDKNYYIAEILKLIDENSLSIELIRKCNLKRLNFIELSIFIYSEQLYKMYILYKVIIKKFVFF